ncbi:MAG: signal recognition particle-docking protein FtsY [Betaproteobacteria bacterium]|nr:signal recognition particle-docking protein FtsY [Betaproteobacteria bacterium]NBQ81943.1 signal recognition particle-docking protein FtsY [Betaproteobacteria bacterium]NBT65196.1 signal recognition particle-docking protein FtsY [Betaproteobacteria bacterium]NBU01307.1 signal recognition particle-docking protein FtsY [Betaproteobacteria bacterium]NBU66570.1 signal recognition particle-docking protein FtsY [Betaproteobacteria bacterium]
MFGFFRRIKAALAPTPDAAQAPSVDAAQPPSVDAKHPPSVESKQPPSVDARHRPAEVQAFAEESTEAPAQVKPAERISWFARLKGGLAKTRNQLAELFGVVNVDEPLLEDLEAALIQADAGVAAAESLIGALRQAIKQDKLKDVEAVRYRLRDLIRDHLIPLEGGIDLDRSTPLVLMIAGVNGAGKTTSIGKLARHVQREGKTVLLAAGDTFRAAAREQLAIWGERNGVEVISQQGGDPAAVAFDAVSAGRARQSGVVMIDTAGRLPTQSHLMDELRKIRRVIGKAMSDAPHESLLILDGNTGQNMLHQVKAFDEAISLTGLVVTKLDGTAKGGALIALAYQLKQRPIPVYFIGVGEGLDDLQAFRAEEFANALLDC